MAENLYCSRGDVNGWLPSGEIAGSSRIVASTNATSNVLTLDGHGLETNDEVRVRAEEGGTLPAPLVEGVVYFAIRLTNATFQLAASANGAPIDLTATGGPMMVMREPKYEQVIEFRSRWADTFIPAHMVPMGVDEPVHPLVRGIVAKLSANDLLHLDGKASILADNETAEMGKMLERLERGVPLRGAETTAPANLAVTARTASSSISDPRGWGSRCLP